MPKEHIPLKAYLICGFLGAGKTTFILEYLKSAGSNVAVLVNEFGSLGIDGETIQTKGGVDVVEMPGGCVCCSQKQGLIASIKDIADHVMPDLLLVEPSGVAEASELIKALSDKSLDGIIRLDAVVTVIDATTFLEFAEPDAFGLFFLDQVENADMVIVNKIDLIGWPEIMAVEERVREINPQAFIAKTNYCHLDTALTPVRVKSEVVSYKSDFRFSSVSIEPDHALSHDTLERFLSDMIDGKFGKVFRAKGFLNIKNYGCVSIQTTPGRVSVELLGHDLAPRLVLIGHNLDEDSILNNFNLASI